ncbi:MAG: proton-conducting membrane transporter [Lachnospiraceae bacterium]|nr:proton-conducting membrane transporter [Candidatus Equihabitans merdae]
MKAYFMAVAVLLPILSGLLIPVLPIKSRKGRNIYTEIMVILTTILVYALLLNKPTESIVLLSFPQSLQIALHIDGMGSVFCAIVASLWPLATLYAFEYMVGDKREKQFFLFYTMTYGVTLGIAMAADILTMYCFYEALTLVTFPLVMHTMSREAVHATRTYLIYSLGGAAFAFMGMIFILVYGETSTFTAGGVLNNLTDPAALTALPFIFVLAFMGFSVKAAMFPLGAWLPTAGVAPTPVTALLHAVAVVKAGAFACMRLTYFAFGTKFLKGTWAQGILMSLAIFTIVYGCSRAFKETHLKRRLAYSTMSNLSYILFGVLLMSPAGLIGGLAHMVCHAVMKICSFFCAGAINHHAHKYYIHELDGLGRKMPATFLVFTIAGMALMGVPGLCGFVGKWYLAKAAFIEGGALPLIGVFSLLISALLTAIYNLAVSIRAFFPGKDFDYSTITLAHKVDWQMMVPLVIFVIAMVFIGFYSTPILTYLEGIAAAV